MLTDEQKAEGWIEHDGGPCPVSGDTYISVMFRDGTIILSQKPFLWGEAGDGRLSNWTFNPDDEEDDIIAYRPENPHD